MIGRVRSRVVGAVGPRAVHAAEDGLVVGATLTLAATYPPAAAAILFGLGVDSLRPRKVLRALDRMVDEEEVGEQTSYYLAGLLGGGAVGTGAGLVARATLPALTWSEVIQLW